MSSLTLASYTIAPRRFYIHDQPSAEEHIDFHVQSGDYFATLATIIAVIAEFLSENAGTHESPQSFQLSALQSIKSDLMYLDKKYKIVPKNQSE